VTLPTADVLEVSLLESIQLFVDPIMEPSDTQLPATISQAEIITRSDAHTTLVVPALIADLGDDAGWRYVEFFTANIPSRRRTRRHHKPRAGTAECSRSSPRGRPLPRPGGHGTPAPPPLRLRYREPMPALSLTHTQTFLS
jgi:hypothetical protein